MNALVKQLLPHLGAIAILLAISAFYFAPQLSGKVIRQGDIMQYKGASQEVRTFHKATGERSLWTNSMFGGMPTYQINTVFQGNYTSNLDKLIRFNINAPIGLFFTGMIGFYLMMVLLGANQWVGLIGAVAFGLTMNSLVLYEAGHVTKIRATAYFPLIVAGVLLAFQKKYIWGAIIFAVGFALNLFANHVQMTYYFFITLLIFGVAQLVYSIQNNELQHFLKASTALIIAGILAIGSAASNLFVTYEYSKDTMRGDPILLSEGAGDPGSSSETEGLAWDYATRWSNSGIDIAAIFIPGAAGGGSSEKVSTSSPVYKDPTWRRGYVERAGGRAPLYWGGPDFTSGPVYLGAITVFFFLMGLLLIKGPVKWWLALGTLLIIIFSMGKNMSGINRIFFDYAPFFNKFRTPNSALTVASFMMPVLGFLALNQIIQGKNTKEEILNSLKITAGILGGLCLFFLILGPSFFSFTAAGDSRFPEGFDPEVLVETRQALMRSDAFRSLGIVGICAGLVWAYIQKRITQTIVLAGIGFLVFFDVWSIGRRYLENSDFQTRRNYEANFQPRPVDEAILKDQDPHYRVMDYSISPFEVASTSYFHKTIGGGHPAKLQRYQDIIERHLSQSNQRVYDMLNTKYIIGQGQNGQLIQQRNPNALGNAWFVDSIIIVSTPNQEIDGLNNIDPGKDILIHEEFQDYISGLNPEKEGSIRLTDYKPNHITYESNAGGARLAVFSEVWYGPNKGWQAYVDGAPIDHIRANYILRAMRIPSGKHTIEFKFQPQSYYTGVTISRISSGLILLSLIGFLGYNGYQYLQNPPAPTPKPEPVKKPVQKKPIQKTTATRKKKKKKK